MICNRNCYWFTGTGPIPRCGGPALCIGRKIHMDTSTQVKPKWTQAMDGSAAEVELSTTAIDGGLHAGEFHVDGSRDYGSFPDWGRIVWQHGPIQEVGRNGILLEELLEYVLIPRLQGFNRDRIPCPEHQNRAFDVGELCETCFDTGTVNNPFRNRETSLAITHLEEALNWLKRRTELRRRQGVEGTFQPHRS